MPKTIRKPFIFAIGFSVVAAGIAMLVLPGPGWAAIFLGFAILATEFAFAERVRDWLIHLLKSLIEHSKIWVKKHPWQVASAAIVLVFIIFLIFTQLDVKYN